MKIGEDIPLILVEKEGLHMKKEKRHYKFYK